MSFFGKLVRIFGELVLILGELVNIFGKLVHIFAWKLVSRTSKQVSKNLGPVWQPGLTIIYIYIYIYRVLPVVEPICCL